MLDNKLTSINFDTCIYFMNHYYSISLYECSYICNMQITIYICKKIKGKEHIISI